MSNMITRTEQNYAVSDLQVMAAAVAKSGLFGMKTQEQALALMLLAQAEGQHPAIAARDYHVIDGRPALKADAMLARFQAAGGKVNWTSYTDDDVTAVFSHPQGGDITIGWTMERAKKAGLGNKKIWSQYPRQMLRARVISEGIRTVFPGVIAGLYTPEEAQDFEPDHKPAERVKKEATVTAQAIEHTAEPATELPEYSSEQFDKNFDAWRGMIASGKKSPEQIVTMIASKYRLSDDQRAAILDCGIPAMEAEMVEEPA